MMQTHKNRFPTRGVYSENSVSWAMCLGGRPSLQDPQKVVCTCSSSSRRFTTRVCTLGNQWLGLMLSQLHALPSTSLRFSRWSLPLQSWNTFKTNLRSENPWYPSNLIKDTSLASEPYYKEGWASCMIRYMMHSWYDYSVWCIGGYWVIQFDLLMFIKNTHNLLWSMAQLILTSAPTYLLIPIII